MKKVGIITIVDMDNYGNRLQNYALSNYCSRKLKCTVYTLKNQTYSNEKKLFVLRMIKHYFNFFKTKKNVNQNRMNNFNIFNENIKFYKKNINCFTNLNIFDYLIVGSDQIWNPYFRRMRDVDVLKKVKPEKRISYAASIGVDEIPQEKYEIIQKEISQFKALSVREESGKNILNKVLDRDDIEVLIDPTMLLTSEEWSRVEKKPIMLKNKKYILNYFLGDLSPNIKKEIESVAEANNCDVINLLDKNSPFYECGPSEFLYLERNAFLICTDSFHSSVFAFLYNRPFIIFDRKQNNIKKMNSRLETLLNKFELKNRKFEGKITIDNINHDYSHSYSILEEERKKSEKFLKDALDIKK